MIKGFPKIEDMIVLVGGKSRKSHKSHKTKKSRKERKTRKY